MSEMVERIARRSFAAWAKERGRNDVTFEDMPPYEREWSLKHAREMIEEMRVPTEAMVRAGDSEIPDNVGYTNDAKAVYRAMLNEAIK